MGPGQVVPSRNGSSTFIYYTYIFRIGIIPVPHVYKHQAGVLPTAKVAKSPSIQHLQSSHQTIVTFTEGSHFTSISYPGKPLAIQRFPFFEKKQENNKKTKHHAVSMDKIWLTCWDKNFSSTYPTPESFLVHQAYQIQQRITRYTRIYGGSGDKKLIEVPLHPCAPNSDLASTLDIAATKGRGGKKW